MSMSFHDWIIQAHVGSHDDQVAIYSKLKIVDLTYPIEMGQYANILQEMHSIARRDSVFPKSDDEAELRRYYVSVFTTPELAASRLLVRRDQTQIEKAFAFLHQRFLSEREMTPEQRAKLIPRRLTPEEESKWGCTFACIGMMVFGYATAGEVGLGSAIGIFGTVLLVVWLGNSGGGKGTGVVETPGGRSSDMYDAGGFGGGDSGG